MTKRKASPELATSFGDRKQLEKAYQDKLRQSMLTDVDAYKLKFELMTAQQMTDRLTKLPAYRAGFKIPYFDISGKLTKFFRVRYLEYGMERGFAAITAMKPLRYGQQADTVNELYLPPSIKWKDIADDTSRPIVITEGELKAACGCKSTIPTIGLGGVWCFRSAVNLAPILPAFADFRWEHRPVYICYDSDAVHNVQVIAAENALARELLKLGAEPYVVRLPELAKGTKCGLDDYLVAKGLDEFMQLMEHAEPWQEASELFRLNEKVLYVVDPGLILVRDTMQKMAPRAFTDHAFSTYRYMARITSEDGKTTRMVEKSAPKEWLQWPCRSEVQRLTYRPDMPSGVNGNEMNMWPGWGCEPQRGEVKPWHELLEYLFAGAENERTWFERWLAYPLQFPGTKLYSAAVLWGITQGTGKSLVGYTMFRIYGYEGRVQNATEITDRDLYSNHNEWAQNKQFIMGDEIASSTEKRVSSDHMKSMLTQRQLRINAKYVPAYTVPDCINYLFTSNHPDAFFMEDNDRRFFVHEVRGKPKPRDFYSRYVKWLDNGGAEALFAYLLELPLVDFDPQGAALETASKHEMIASGRSDVASWVAELRDSPDNVLKVGEVPLPYKLWTSSELLRLYDPEQRSRVTRNGLGRELKRAGVPRVYEGMGVLTATVGRQRLWALRDVEVMMKTAGPRLAEIYDEERSKNGTGRKKKF